MSSNQYDASSSALGYIYQIKYALLESLKMAQRVDDPDLYYVSIEKLDDIAFEKEGTPEQLLQVKHHGTPANLQDKSPDIWKTLRIWAEYLKKDEEKFKNSTFYLITTELAAKDSLAFFLSVDESRRNIDEASIKIQKIISDVPSKANKEGFEAFKSLNGRQQKLLLQNIYIVDEVASIDVLEKNLSSFLRIHIHKEHLNSFVRRLESEWFNLAIDNLKNKISNICLGYLLSIINNLRDQFLSSNLPTDYSEWDIPDFSNENKVFIEQIKLFATKSGILETANKNYWRAYYQRQSWQDDGLLKPNEMKRYFEKLYDEWDNCYSLKEAGFNLSEEINKKNFAFEVYSFCQTNGAIPIRTTFNDKFVAIGSYHQLADELKIGWHPDFKEKLQAASSENVV